MEWYKAKNVDELKKLGKFRAVSKIVKDDCRGIVNIKLGSWKNLYNSIQAFKGLINDVQGEFSSDNKGSIKEFEINSNNKEVFNNEYFTSKASEYIFYLIELDGKERMDKLNVTIKHYSNKKMAKDWRDKIVKEIHSDRCKVKGADEALAKLNQLYAGMVGNEK